MKLQNLKIYLYISIFTIFSITNIFSADIAGLGSIVYDPTNASNMVTQISNLETSIKHQIDIMKAIGRGDFNPQVIGYLDNLYTSCGGKKYALPDFYPNIKISNMCSSNKNNDVKAVIDYFIPTPKDTPEVRVKKQQNKLANQPIVQGVADLQSQITVTGAKEENDKINKELINASKSASSSIEVEKLQLQVQLQTLQQLQRNNELLAHLIQYMVWK